MTVKVTQVTAQAMVQSPDADTDVWVSNVWVEVLADAPPPLGPNFSNVAFSHDVYGDVDISFEKGDRGAFDVHLSGSLHASDIAANAPTRHNPLPGASGNAPVSDGSKYVSQAVSLASHTHNIITLGSKEGNLEVATSPLRVYNRYGATRTILEVYVAVNTAPTGSSARIDILKDGVSIFALDGDKPTIADAGNTASSTTFDDDQWLAGEYLQIEIETIGSTTPGADLTVHIVTS